MDIFWSSLTEIHFTSSESKDLHILVMIVLIPLWSTSVLPEWMSLLTRHGFWWFKKNAIQMSNYKIPVRWKASPVRNTYTVASVCGEPTFGRMVPEPLPWIKLSSVIFNWYHSTLPTSSGILPPNITMLHADSQFALAKVHQGPHQLPNCQHSRCLFICCGLWSSMVEVKHCLFEFASVKLSLFGLYIRIFAGPSSATCLPWDTYNARSYFPLQHSSQGYEYNHTPLYHNG